METRHVRIDYDAALQAKKELLSLELNLLQIQRRIKAYLILRKKEIAKKNQIKVGVKSLKNKLNLLTDSIPHKESKIEKIKKAVKKVRKKEKNNIQSELDEIKRKLAKLG